MNSSTNTQTIVIRPERTSFSLASLGEVWQYRDLFYFLIWKDVKAQYAQSVLGIGWAVVRPIFSMVVFTVIFGKLAKIDSDGLPYALFSFAGVVPWTYFSTALSTSSGSLASAVNLVQKVYVPRVIIPLAPVLSKLVDFSISMVIFFGMAVWYKAIPTWSALFLPLLVLIMMMTAYGIGLWLTSLAVQYRDVKHMLGFGVQLMMYVSPVVYPVSMVPEQYRLLYGINPMAGVIEGFRAGLLGSVAMPWDLIGIGFFTGLVILVSGDFSSATRKNISRTWRKMTAPIIKVEGLGKRYRIGLKEKMHDTLTGAFLAHLKSPLNNFRRLKKLASFSDDQSEDIIWALKDVSFEIETGEVVGIIGKNGAGKSTLLKILSRITTPTEGQAVITGRISSLLEVGTGFHSELTGRENVYLNGTILGMSKKEIDRKFDEIVDFSGVEKFIDTPVKRYSSGMTVRLAFSVAAHLEPEILLIDEVLAVGDAEFQKKCLGKMKNVASQGRTVLFVSHNMAAVNRLCEWCLWLEEGKVKDKLPAQEAVQKYLAESAVMDSDAIFDEDEEKDAQFTSVRITDEHGQDMSEFGIEQPVTVEFDFQVRKKVPGLYLIWYLETAEGVIILFSDIRDDKRHREVELEPGLHRFRSEIPAWLLGANTYYLSLGAASMRSRKGFSVDKHLQACSFTINDFQSYRGHRRPGIIGTLVPWEKIA